MRTNTSSKFAIIFSSIIISLLAVGCSEKQAAQTAPETPASYSGFMDLKAGMWSEMTVKSGTASTTMKTELIENSPSESRFQVTTTAGSQDIIAQMWIDRETGKATKYVVKTGNTITCPDVGSVPKNQLPAKADTYPENPELSIVSYSTSTGKKVSAVKFTKSGTETWVSSEVPFGVVKVASGGKTVMSLHDFGMIGAKSMLTEKEIAGCGSATETSAEAETGMGAETGTSTETGKASETESSAQTAATEDASTDDEDTTVTTSVITNEGEEASLPCAQCKGMPAAALKACLAACS